MSKIIIKKDGIFDWLFVNGRRVELGRFERIEKTGNGKWQGTASGYDFTIIGGKESGGAKNEWLVKWDVNPGCEFTECKSAIAAINWINRQW